MSAPPQAQGPRRVDAAALDRFCRAVLAAAGADAGTVDAATRAMLHGSRLGVDSHGVRLLGHYVAVLQGGRVNPRPAMTWPADGGAVAVLDADNGHGALATFHAVDHAVGRARTTGLAAVAIRNSSHFGPAGAYALAAAEAGMIGLVTCNADSYVRLHGGAERFHGTNPLACAVPVAGGRPWLLDMATSAIPYNRIQLYKSLGRDLPPGTASAAGGIDTVDPAAAQMLAPLGGDFGFKGAGLAGLSEILSAVLTGMRLSFEIAPMAGPDLASPRGLGAFVLVLRPQAFLPEEDFDAGMRRYLAALRRSAARPGEEVLAPGDREWAEADRRAAAGIPIDPDTEAVFRDLVDRFGLAPPAFAAAPDAASAPPGASGAKTG
ncbi:Ldh family oxidoreductase [Marinibaculum pumilum]|uniref:Ldh family oxidoreductase n=1 Tax=Marinibaculum pumilum TaxID=1766165 RepID=A0ABV7L799_9PROT